MAVDYTGLRCTVPGVGTSPGTFIYTSAEARTSVEATDYFALGSQYGLKVGDVVTVVYTTGYVATVHAVSAVDADGNATISAAVLS